MSHSPLPLAVIGAGFSGTMTALNLIAHAPDRRVLLCERGPTFARGAAYSTADPVHLLNVRASNMSAYPTRPNDFTEWLSRQDDIPSGHRHEMPAGLFVSRAVYGRYLSHLVQKELSCADGAARLRIVPDEGVALHRRSDDSYTLTLSGGREHRVAGAIVAIGNLIEEKSALGGPIVRDPWAVRFTDGLIDGRPVVIVGTGLTTADVVTSLWVSGFSGPVLAISRRGLLPRTHVSPAPWRLSRFGGTAREPLSRLVRLFRQEVEDARRTGLPWQSVMDAARPITVSLWRGLTSVQRARFIRHLRPWWDVHRHRMAPPVAQQLHGLIEQDFLRVAAGKMVSAAESGPNSVEVCWAPRDGTGPETITAQRVIYATGATAVSSVQDALVTGLLDSGMARIDPLGLGLDVTADLEIVGAGGDVSPTLWAIGPTVRGAFWECTAVPDIRADAERLAKRIATTLAAAEGSRMSP